MAERPKTAAQLAEESGELEINNLTARVREYIEKVANLSAWAAQINDRLGWIISSVRASYSTANPGDISNEYLQQILTELKDLEDEAMKAHDILIGDSTT